MCSNWLTFGHWAFVHARADLVYQSWAFRRVQRYLHIRVRIAPLRAFELFMRTILYYSNTKSEVQRQERIVRLQEFCGSLLRLKKVMLCFIVQSKNEYAQSLLKKAFLKGSLTV